MATKVITSAVIAIAIMLIFPAQASALTFPQAHQATRAWGQHVAVKMHVKSPRASVFHCHRRTRHLIRCWSRVSGYGAYRILSFTGFRDDTISEVEVLIDVRQHHHHIRACAFATGC